MDIKLITKSLVIILLVCSCATSKKSKVNDYNVTKEAFVGAYKNAVVCGCINGGTNNKLKLFIAESSDLGLSQEFQVTSFEIMNEADSIGKEYSKMIKPIEYSDIRGKKPIISSCLTYGYSKKIDSIALIRYKLTLEK